MELIWSTRFTENLRAQAALTWLDARYSDTFKTCTFEPAPGRTWLAGASAQHSF